jgi:hypothetical protein
MSKVNKAKQTDAQLLIRSLVRQNVKHIFGIPGGKIMPTFDVLRDEGPQLVLCRHEQNAAFMAAAVGRLTGRPGICLVTSVGIGVASKHSTFVKTEGRKRNGVKNGVSPRKLAFPAGEAEEGREGQSHGLPPLTLLILDEAERHSHQGTHNSGCGW